MTALPAYIERKIERQPDGCWLWTGFLTEKGYGKVCYQGNRHWRIHRLTYELLVGPIPEGLQIDHLCRVRHCCNPSHLEPVTCKENLRRSPLTLNSINAAKTHCVNGHEFTPENTYRHGIRRQCKACVAETQRRRAERAA